MTSIRFMIVLHTVQFNLGFTIDNLSLTDDDLIQAMLADPLLINRPIVVSDKGVKLCRPSEVVLDLIDTPLTKTFIKEDGEKIEPTI